MVSFSARRSKSITDVLRKSDETDPTYVLIPAFCRSVISAEEGPGGGGTRMIFSLPLEPAQAKA